MTKDSKLEKIGREKFPLKETLKAVGLVYSIFLGVPTLGALGGLAYSIYNGDNTPWGDIGCGAIVGGVLEFFGIMFYGMTPTRTDE